jgi:hypothetical protein
VHGDNLVIIFDTFNAYFDRSYSEKDDETTVAGFVSSVQQWGQWEAEWKLALAEFEVPYFHMKEFNAKQDAFKAPKWKSNAYRAMFMSKLIAITNQWAIAGISSTCEQKVFDAVNKVWELDRRFNPYAFCGRDCAIRVKKLVRQQIGSDAPIAYIFDRGDEGRGMLMKEMERSDLPSPIFKRSRPDPKNKQLDTDDPPVVQLQACDLLAWELMRRQQDARRGAQRHTFRKSVLALSQINNRHWFGSDINDVTNLCIAARIAKRAPDPSVAAHLYWVTPCTKNGCQAIHVLKHIGLDDGRDTWPGSGTPKWAKYTCSDCGSSVEQPWNNFEIHKLNAAPGPDFVDAW